MVLVVGLLRGREHSAIVRAMKAESGVRFAGRDKLVHLVGLGEVVERLRRGVADRGHRPIQAGDDFSNRNQLAAFALHGFILPQLAAPVYWRKPIVFCTVRGTEINR